jgi:uncharacterized protein YjbI with pentapeptide repeats
VSYKIYDRTGNVLYSKDDAEFNKSIDLDGLNLSNAQMPDFSFEGLMLTETCFAGANLSHANFYWAVLLDSNLEGANLQYADMRGVKLIRCNLRKANLRGVDLGCNALGSPSSLDGSDFTGAALAGANFEGAIIDSATKLPKEIKRRLSYRQPTL